MFALVVVDKVCHEVHLYRDLVGVKPLFYWADPTGEALVFASDVKTISQSKLFRPAIAAHANRRSLSLTLAK